MLRMSRLALGAVLAVGLSHMATPSMAQEDCQAMAGQIDQLLQTAELTEEERNQVMQLRDQGLAEDTSKGGDCTTPLSQALQILQQE